MSDASEVLLSLQVPGESRVVEFSTLEEFESWNNEEAKFWQWLTQEGNPFSQRGTEHANFHTAVRNSINQFRQHTKNSDQVSEFRGRVTAHFDQFYNLQHHRLSDSPEARFVEQQRMRGGSGLASGTYAALFNVNQAIPSIPHIWEGLIDGYLFKHDIAWSADAHREILKYLENQLETQIQHHAAEVRSFTKQASDACAAEENIRISWQKQAAEQLIQQQQQFLELRTGHEEALRTIETTYSAKVALQAPVEYWNRKERFHKKRVFWFAFATAGAFVSTGTALCLICHWIFNESEKAELKHWQLGIGILAAFFAIWVVRIFVRILFSHIHLGSDAAERQVIVQTFLALSREGQEFTPKEKDIILTQLFRPASDGIVKDDAAPAGLLEIFSRK